jgi:hypothetical protein
MYGWIYCWLANYFKLFDRNGIDGFYLVTEIIYELIYNESLAMHNYQLFKHNVRL